MSVGAWDEAGRRHVRVGQLGRQVLNTQLLPAVWHLSPDCRRLCFTVARGIGALHTIQTVKRRPHSRCDGESAAETASAAQPQYRFLAPPVRTRQAGSLGPQMSPPDRAVAAAFSATASLRTKGHAVARAGLPPHPTRHATLLAWQFGQEGLVPSQSKRQEPQYWWPHESTSEDAMRPWHRLHEAGLRMSHSATPAPCCCCWLGCDAAFSLPPSGIAAGPPCSQRLTSSACAVRGRRGGKRGGACLTWRTAVPLAQGVRRRGLVPSADAAVCFAITAQRQATRNGRRRRPPHPFLVLRLPLPWDPDAWRFGRRLNSTQPSRPQPARNRAPLANASPHRATGFCRPGGGRTCSLAQPRQRPRPREEEAAGVASSSKLERPKEPPRHGRRRGGTR